MASRTYGLSGSGMDVDQLVKDLMKARRTQYDQVVQKKTQTEWRKADFNTLYTSVKTYRNSTIWDYKSQKSLFSPKKAVSTSESVATAQAYAASPNIAHSLKVDQLADSVKKSSNGTVTPAGYLKDTLATQFGLADGTFKIKLTNGDLSKEIEVKTSGSINDFVSSVNSSGTNIKAYYDTVTDKVSFYTTNTGASASIDFTGSEAAGLSFLKDNLKINTAATFRGSSAAVTTGAGTANLGQQLGITGPASFTIKNGASSAVITVDPSETMAQLVADINNAGINIQAAYNADTDRFTLNTTNKSADAGITFTGTNQAGMAFLTNNLKLNTADYAQNGTDAIFDLDGMENMSRDSNSFTISDMTYSLKATGSTTVTVSSDIDATIANVKKFVDEYNKILSGMNSEYSEKVYNDYLPLTDDQKADMKDSEITAWDAKAKSGMLHANLILRDAMDAMRSSLSSKVEGIAGKYNSAASLGITTGKYFDSDGNLTTEWKESGKLYVDETALRKALEDDPDAAAKLFGADGADTAHQGIANRLYDAMQVTMRRIESEAGTTATVDADTESTLGRSLVDYAKRLNTLKTQMDTEQDRFYKQFDAMEQAINQLNKQSAWLTQQFSTNSSS